MEQHLSVLLANAARHRAGVECDQLAQHRPVQRVGKPANLLASEQSSRITVGEATDHGDIHVAVISGNP